MRRAEVADRLIGADISTVLAAGGVVGDGIADELIEHGAAIGREAAARAVETAGRPRSDRPSRPSLVEAARRVGEPARRAAPYTRPRGAECQAHSEGRARDGPYPRNRRLCRGRVIKDLRAAIEEGYGSIELVKRRHDPCVRAASAHWRCGAGRIRQRMRDRPLRHRRSERHGLPHGGVRRRGGRDDRAGERSYLVTCEWSVGHYLFESLFNAGHDDGIDVDGLRITQSNWAIRNAREH